MSIRVVPGRIDILTELTGLTFAEAWLTRIRRRSARLMSM